MNFYITPSNRKVVANKIEKITKYFVKKPVVTFSDVKDVEIVDVHILNDMCGGKFSKYSRYTVPLIEVNIDYVVSNDWVLVATVYHRNNIITKVSDAYFKHIPAEFGLDYRKCDSCGKFHGSRTESHIVYNPIENKWMQIGTACVNKVLADGKYLSSFMVKLGHVIDMTGSCYCDDISFGSWCRGCGSKLVRQAIHINQIIPVITEYRKEKPNWIKVTYMSDDWGRDVKVPGSTDHLSDMIYSDTTYEPDYEYNAKVFEFVKNLEPKSEFVEEIKKTFEAEYINVYEVAKVFFGVKMYEDSLIEDDFTPAVEKAGIVQGERYNVTGHIAYTQFVDNYDEYSYYAAPWERLSYTEYYIKDEKSGLLFMTKSDTIKRYYVNDEVGYSFMATVSFPSVKKKIVYTRGRLAKAPKVKYAPKDRENSLDE